MSRAERELESDVVVLSMIENRRDPNVNRKRQEILEATNLIREGILPWYIDIVSVTRPFILMNGLVVRFENLLTLGTKLESKFNVCDLFTSRVVKVLDCLSNDL